MPTKSIIHKTFPVMKTLRIMLILVAVVAAATVEAQVQPTNPTGVTTEVKGTPYLDEAYQDGTILFANNTRTAPIRYNAWKDLIEYKQDNGQPRVLDASATIKKVQLGSTTFHVEKFESNGVEKYGYFTLIDSGKVTLFSRKAMKFTPALKGRALDGGDQPAEFRRLPDVYYVKVGDQPLTEVKSLKALLAAFPDKNEELSSYAKKEKISFKDEGELKQLVSYYNSL